MTCNCYIPLGRTVYLPTLVVDFYGKSGYICIYIPSRWWQLKYFLFSPVVGQDEPILTSIFFRWVETTNQLLYSRLQGGVRFCFFFLLKIHADKRQVVFLLPCFSGDGGHFSPTPRQNYKNMYWKLSILSHTKGSHD